MHRPGDIAASIHCPGQLTYADLTIGNSMQKSHMPRAATTPGFVADLLAANKHKGPGASSVARAGQRFVAVAGESLGGWNKEATDFFHEICSKVADRTNSDKHDLLRQLLQQLGVAIQAGNHAIHSQQTGI